MTEKATDPPDRPKGRRRRRRWWRWLVVMLVMLAGLAWWLNGPGVRWLLPQVAGHFAGRSGVVVEFEVSGTLTGGLVFRGVDVSIDGTPLRGLTITELKPDYDWRRLLRGEVRGVFADGIHLELLLPAGDEDAERDDEDFEMPDFAALSATFEQIRERVLAYGIDVRRLTAVVKMGEDGARVELGESSIFHQPGGEAIVLTLGEIARDGEVWVVAQGVEVAWQRERLALGAVVLHPALTVDALEVLYPAEGSWFLEAAVRVADAVFAVSAVPDLGTLGVHLREGELDAERAMELAGLEVAAAGRMTSFALDVAELLPDPMQATATLSVLVENARWDGVDLVLDELGVDVILNVDDVRSVVRVAVEDALARVDATTTLDRESMRMGRTVGALEVPSVVAMAGVLEGFWQEAVELGEIPQSRMEVDFSVVWDEVHAPSQATAEMRMDPVEPERMTGLRLEVNWGRDVPIEVRAQADGLAVQASVDLEADAYVGEVVMEGLDSLRFVRWLEVAGVELPGTLMADGVWRGRGALKAEGHAGELTLAGATWSQPEQPVISAAGGVSYEWPGRVEVRDLEVTRDGQVLAGAFALDDGWLVIDALRWTDADGTEMADAKGTVPVPEALGDLTSFPAGDDAREIDLAIRTATLGFDKLAAWVPALDVVDGAATARLEVAVSGTFGDPELAMAFELRGVRMVDQDGLPAADLILNSSGKDGVLALDGRIETREYDPVVLTATLPFAPAEWAGEPDLLQEAEVSASAVLPRLDLRQFAVLAPGLRNVAGVLAGQVRVTGTLGEPVVNGRLELSGGRIGFPDEVFPDVTGISAVANLDVDRVVLESLRATVAGGTLDGGGTFAIADRELDLRVRARSLPLVRGEGLIVRANADLRATGPLDAATLSGTVSTVDSLIFRDIEILPLGTPFRVPDAAALPKIDTAPPTDAVPEMFAGWPLDVRLTTEEPILIRGNLATGRILIDLRVGGTMRDPRPNGQVRLLRGRAVLPFSTLAVPEALIQFTPANGLDPTIEFRGTAEPRPYTVNLFAYGRLSDPQIVLTSNPPLPQHEIMTLLATGTTTRGLEDPQAASSRALQLFAEEVRRGRVPLGNQLRPLLGILDRVDFTLAESDPYSSDTFSTATLQLHDRWYLSAGMGDEGNTRMFAIWRLRFR